MLIAATNLSHQYGEKVILHQANFYLNPGEKIGLVGVNGVGKSTFMKILSGEIVPDAGQLTFQSKLKIKSLPQTMDWDPESRVLEQVMLGNKSHLSPAKEYEAKAILNQLAVGDFQQKVGLLSGGEKKRVAIAGALIQDSDVLLLDEPTNHLDSEMIEWLENYLKKIKKAIIMITHDRYFLDQVTQRIIEMEEGSIYSYEANYSKYLELKSQRLEEEKASQRKMKSLYAKELEWVRQGPKARGTKSKDRLERFNQLEEHLDKSSNRSLALDSIASRLGKKIMELEAVSKSYGDKTLLDSFSFLLSKEDRIGIVGPNGCGKSTLLKLILGDIKPDSGSVALGDTIKIGYYSQLEVDMDGDKKVIDFVKEQGEFIETTEGKISASQLLDKFLFSGAAQWNLIKFLSGGEKKRLKLMAVLASRPNCLLLDEPTNDLDIQTLTILEDYLGTFPGPIITISHDRYFLDKVVDHLWIFGKQGQIIDFWGNYSDLQEKTKRGEIDILSSSQPKIPSQTQSNQGQKVEDSLLSQPPSHYKNREKAKDKAKKLAFTYKEQQEMGTIDQEIAQIEAQIKDCEDRLNQSARDYQATEQLWQQKQELEILLQNKMERWEYLYDLADKILQNEGKQNEGKE